MEFTIDIISKGAARLGDGVPGLAVLNLDLLGAAGPLPEAGLGAGCKL